MSPVLWNSRVFTGATYRAQVHKVGHSMHDNGLPGLCERASERADNENLLHLPLLDMSLNDGLVAMAFSRNPSTGTRPLADGCMHIVPLGE